MTADQVRDAERLGWTTHGGSTSGGFEWTSATGRDTGGGDFAGGGAAARGTRRSDQAGWAGATDSDIGDSDLASGATSGRGSYWEAGPGGGGDWAGATSSGDSAGGADAAHRGGGLTDAIGGGPIADAAAAPGGPPAPPAPASPRPSQPRPERRVNVAVSRVGETGSDLRPLAADEPMVRGQSYQIEVLVARDRSGVSVEGADRSILEPKQPGPIKLQVTLDGDGQDFEINRRMAVLDLPTHGDTPKGARFRVKPRSVTAAVLARARLTIRIYWGFNVVEQLVLKVEVAADDTRVSPLGLERPLEIAYFGELARHIDATSVVPRAMTITVSREFERYVFKFLLRNEHDQTVTYRGSYWGVEPEALDQRLRDIRTQLWQAGHEPIYGSSLNGGEVYADALRRVAVEGRRLWSLLFESGSSQGDMWQIGERLLRRPVDRGGTIQVVLDPSAETFVFPWTLLYDGAAPPESASPSELFEGFWGARYIVEQLAPESTADDGSAASLSPPRISYLFWPFHPHWEPHESEVRSFAASIGAVLDPDTPVKSAAVAKKLLAACDSRLIYFFTHGYTERRNGDGVPDFITMYESWPEALKAAYRTQYVRATGTDGRRSRITLESGDVFLDELQRAGNLELRAQPIVFLNMCESAQVAPTMAASFIRTFLDRGAVSVIGTECATRPIAGREVARRVFASLAKGEPVGRALLDARRALGTELRNPLGLAYTLYGSSTARVTSGRERENSAING